MDDALNANASSKSHSNSDWVARYPWIREFGIEYYLGVDGISMPLVLLTTVLSFLSMLAPGRSTSSCAASACCS